ncbi:hypothetical protein [Asanoa siamensis]|uniref:Uncharacterized protein n=1 Tax=Asanoa siamensis TaxID=926357 RepID=A0ABQ4CP31_9ACTN|nr:hypothetical protein [Asanoa siamensis]GIF73046.1 hypothetical protein Asi02nite_25640 [Asanoa siamensis]
MMEGHLRPLPDWATVEVFRPIREPGVGERLVLEENFLLDALLPAAIPGVDLSEYRRPYPDPASRRPLLQWARQIPVAGHPSDVVELLVAGPFPAGWRSQESSSSRRTRPRRPAFVASSPNVHRR